MRAFGQRTLAWAGGITLACFASLAIGPVTVFATTWQNCPNVEYWERVQAKGVSCATAYKVRDRAVERVTGSLPIDWQGRVGSWVCTYKNAQGPGSLKCAKGAKKVRWDHGA